MHWTTGPRGTRPPAAPAPRYTPRAREARGAAVTPQGQPRGREPALTSLGSPARRRSSSPSRARLLRPRGNRSPRAPPRHPRSGRGRLREARARAPPRPPGSRGNGGGAERDADWPGEPSLRPASERPAPRAGPRGVPAERPSPATASCGLQEAGPGASLPHHPLTKGRTLR